MPGERESFCQRSVYLRNTCSIRSEEHTSELQSQSNLVCRLLLEKKKKIPPIHISLPRPLSFSRNQAHMQHGSNVRICYGTSRGCTVAARSVKRIVHMCKSSLGL